MEIEFWIVHGFPAGIQVVLVLMSSSTGLAETPGEDGKATRVMTSAKLATITTYRNLNIVLPLLYIAILIHGLDI